MNQNIIFGLLIVFLIIIIILLILLLVYPSETYSLAIGLGICTIITGIVGWLYNKEITKCACGKGECKKCGGIDRIDDNLKKFNLLLLSYYINKDSLRIPNNREDENKLNLLLQSIDPKLTRCTFNTVRDFNGIEIIFNTVGIKSKDYNEFKDRYETYEVVSKNIALSLDMVSIVPPLNDIKNNKKYELIGFIEATGDHFIAYVKYSTGWYLRDSLKYNDSDNIENNTPIDDVEIEKKIDELYNTYIDENYCRLVYTLYRDKDRTKLNTYTPPIFKQFQNICYTAAPLQLLIATDLLKMPVPLAPSTVPPAPSTVPPAPSTVPTICPAQKHPYNIQNNQYDQYCKDDKLNKFIALQLHPDKNKDCDKEASEKMKNITNDCNNFYNIRQIPVSSESQASSSPTPTPTSFSWFWSMF